MIEDFGVFTPDGYSGLKIIDAFMKKLVIMDTLWSSTSQRFIQEVFGFLGNQNIIFCGRINILYYREIKIF